MRGLLRKRKLAAIVVELDSPFDKLLYVFCAVRNERFDGFRIAKSGTRHQRVFFMKLGVVVIRKHYCNAALRVLRIRFARLVLCQDSNAGTRFR